MAKKLKKLSKKIFAALVVISVISSQVSFLLFTAAQEENYFPPPDGSTADYQQFTEFQEPTDNFQPPPTDFFEPPSYEEPAANYQEPYKEPGDYYPADSTTNYQPPDDYQEPFQPLKDFFAPLIPDIQEPDSYPIDYPRILKENFTDQAEPYRLPADFVKPEDLELIPQLSEQEHQDKTTEDVFFNFSQPDEPHPFFEEIKDQEGEQKDFSGFPPPPSGEFKEDFGFPPPPDYPIFEPKDDFIPPPFPGQGEDFGFPPFGGDFKPPEGEEDRMEIIREKMESQEYLPPACQEAGVTTPEECHKLMAEKFEQQAESPEFFKPFEGEGRGFFDFGPPADERMPFRLPPVEFFNASELKDDSNLLPPICQQNRIHDKNDCFEFIKYKEDLPQKCRDQGITDPKECGDLMHQSNLPPECVEEGFTNFEDCKQTMGRQFLPPECIDAGAGTEDECEKIMMSRRMPPECQKRGITDPKECEKMFFNRNMPYECVEAGVSTQDECKKIMEIQRMPPECRDAGITDMRDCKILMMKDMMPPPCAAKGITSPQECEQLMMSIHMPPECKEAGLANMDDCEQMLMKKYMPRECQEAGVTTEEACEKIMIGKLMPKKCKEAGATNKEECEKIIIAEQDKLDEIDFDKELPAQCGEAGITDKQECKNLLAKDHLPMPCQQAGIYQWKECRDFLDRQFMPPECIEAGAADEQECDKIMRKKHMPPECVEAEATTPEECDKVMQQKYLPRECKENGLITRKECDEYFMVKYMPLECRAAGAATPQECDKIMRQTHLAPECKAAGITDDRECEEYMFDKYRPPEFECEGFTKKECEEEIKGKHLGLLIKGRKEKVKIKEKMLRHVGKRIVFKDNKLTNFEEIKDQEGEEDDLSEMEAGLIETLPFDTSQDLAINILPSEEKSLLKEESDTIVQTIPIIIIIDSDQDGLPDDMEEMIGSDPNNADSDGDGYSDGEEVRNDFDPTGEGELIRDLAPIETAILNGETIEQPLTDGELKENLMKVNEVAGSKTDDGSLVINGTSVPNSVVTLYMYSTIAIMVNVQADEQGKWTYEFDEKLKDGEHDIYATITNEKGEIEVKSNPKSFFIKEARAQEVKEFMEEEAEEEAAAAAQAQPKQAKQTLTDQVRSYGFAGSAIIIVFLIILWIILHQIKKRVGPKQ